MWRRRLLEGARVAAAASVAVDPDAIAPSPKRVAVCCSRRGPLRPGRSPVGKAATTAGRWRSTCPNPYERPSKQWEMLGDDIPAGAGSAATVTLAPIAI